MFVFSCGKTFENIFWIKCFSSYETIEETNSKESLQLDLESIRDATNDFSATNFLGMGGFGEVFNVDIFILQVSLAIAGRYKLKRRAFSLAPKGPEILLLDYPSHQRQILPLLAET